MPSVRYYNQTAPFWDFVANFEEQGAAHPWHAQRSGAEGSENENEFANPWAAGWAGFPWGQMPHRGRHRGPHGRHHGPPHPPPPPPPPPHPAGPSDPPPPPPPPPGYEGAASSDEEKQDPEAGPSDPTGPPPPFSAHHQFGPGSRRGRCGGRGRGAFAGRGRAPFPGAWGGRGGNNPFGDFGRLAEMFQSQLFGQEGEEGENGENGDRADDFKPDVDVFDAAEAFVVHVSLAGAKKEDVGVNWDPEKSELGIAGVVYRPGEEEFLKTLAMNERRIGPFERKVRLGSRANPAHVDVDGITARMEDGVLTVEVPKLDSGYVEIKKVDIE